MSGRPGASKPASRMCIVMPLLLSTRRERIPTGMVVWPYATSLFVMVPLVLSVRKMQNRLSWLQCLCTANAPDRECRRRERPMADNGQKIIELDQKRMQATVKQDYATLESIIAD